MKRRFKFYTARVLRFKNIVTNVEHYFFTTKNRKEKIVFLSLPESPAGRLPRALRVSKSTFISWFIKNLQISCNRFYEANY